MVKDDALEGRCEPQGQLDDHSASPATPDSASTAAATPSGSGDIALVAVIICTRHGFVGLRAGVKVNRLTGNRSVVAHTALLKYLSRRGPGL
jgi:hypothetical protein